MEGGPLNEFVAATAGFAAGLETCPAVATAFRVACLSTCSVTATAFGVTGPLSFPVLEYRAVDPLNYLSFTSCELFCFGLLVLLFGFVPRLPQTTDPLE